MHSQFDHVMPQKPAIASEVRVSLDVGTNQRKRNHPNIKCKWESSLILELLHMKLRLTDGNRVKSFSPLTASFEPFELLGSLEPFPDRSGCVNVHSCWKSDIGLLPRTRSVDNFPVSITGFCEWKKQHDDKLVGKGIKMFTTSHTHNSISSTHFH